MENFYNYQSLPTCRHVENGIQCQRISALVPSAFGQSFLGCNSPLCEVHALPLVYNHFQGMWTAPPQITQIRQVEPQVDREKHTCSICTEDIDEPCELRCKHSFHGKCIEQWFTSLQSRGTSPTCPNCRSNVTEQDYRKVRLFAIDDIYNPYDEDDSYLWSDLSMLSSAELSELENNPIDIFGDDLEYDF